jgi:hypothetical protein
LALALAIASARKRALLARDVVSQAVIGFMINSFVFEWQYTKTGHRE